MSSASTNSNQNVIPANGAKNTKCTCLNKVTVLESLNIVNISIGCVGNQFYKKLVKKPEPASLLNNISSLGRIVTSTSLVADAALSDPVVTLTAVGNSSSTTLKKEMNLSTREENHKASSMAPVTSLATEKFLQLQSSASFSSDDDSSAFEGFTGTDLKACSPRAALEWNCTSPSASLRTRTNKPIKRRVAVRRPRPSVEGEKKLFYTGDLKWVKMKPRKSKASLNGAKEFVLPRQREGQEKSEYEADPEYRPYGRRSISFARKKYSTYLEDPHNSCSNRKRNCKRLGGSERLSFTLNNWSAITAKVRQSLRVPKFKVNHDFVTWGDSNPAYLLQRHPHAADELEKTSAVERFTRTLELIARDEQVLLNAAGDEQLQQMLHTPAPDDPFVPAPKDSELDSVAIADDAAKARLASPVKYSIFTPTKVNKCNKYPIYTPPSASVVAARRDGFARWAVMSDVKVSLDRCAVPSNASKPMLVNQISDFQESERSRSTNVEACVKLEVDEKNVHHTEMSSEDKSGAPMRYSSSDCSFRRGGDTRSSTMEEPGYERSSVSSEDNSETSTRLRRSARIPKVKQDEDFISWTEPPSDLNAVYSRREHFLPAAADVTSGSNQKSPEGGTCENTRLTLRRTGSEYEVVHTLVPRKRRRLNARQCRLAGNFTSTNTDEASAEQSHLAASRGAGREDDFTACSKDGCYYTDNKHEHPHSSVCVSNYFQSDTDVGRNTYMENNANKTELSASPSSVTKATPSSVTSVREYSDLSIKDKNTLSSHHQNMSTSLQTRSSLSLLAAPIQLPHKSSPTLADMRSASIPYMTSKKCLAATQAEHQNIPIPALCDQDQLKSIALPSTVEKSSVKMEQHSGSGSSSSSELEPLKKFGSSVGQREITESISSTELQDSNKSILSTAVYKGCITTATVNVPSVRRSARARRVSVKLYRDDVPRLGIYKQSFRATEPTTSEVTADHGLLDEKKSSNVSQIQDSIVDEMGGRHHLPSSQRQRRVEKEMCGVLSECHPQISASSDEIFTTVDHDDQTRMAGCSRSNRVDGSLGPFNGDCVADITEDEGAHPDSRSNRDNGDPDLPINTNTFVTITDCKSNSEGEVRDRCVRTYSEHVKPWKIPFVDHTDPDSVDTDSCASDMTNLSLEVNDFSNNSNYENYEKSSNNCIENNPYSGTISQPSELTNMSYGTALCYTYEGDCFVQADAAKAFIEPLDNFSADDRQSLIPLDGFSKVIPPDSLNASWPLAAVSSSAKPDHMGVKLSSQLFSPIIKTNAAEKLCSPVAPLDTCISLETSTECKLLETATDICKSSQTDEKEATDAEVLSKTQLPLLSNVESKILCHSLEARVLDQKEIPSEDRLLSLDAKATSKYSIVNCVKSKTSWSCVDKEERAVVTEVQSCEVGQSQLPENTSASASSSPEASNVARASKKLRPRTVFCDRCPYRSRALSYFAIHKSQHAEEEERDPSPADAQLGDLVFDGSAMSHLTDTSSLLRCPICTYATVFKASLTLHRKHHEKFADKPSFACPFCIHFTFSKVQLTVHIQAQHGDRSSSSVASEIDANSTTAVAASKISLTNNTPESSSSITLSNGIFSSETCDSNTEPDTEETCIPKCSASTLTLTHGGKNNLCDSVGDQEVKGTNLIDNLSVSNGIVEESKVPSMNSFLQPKAPELVLQCPRDDLQPFDDGNSNDFDGFLPVRMSPVSECLSSEHPKGRSPTESLICEMSAIGDGSINTTIIPSDGRSSIPSSTKTETSPINAVANLVNENDHKSNVVAAVGLNNSVIVAGRRRRPRKFVYKQRCCPYCKYRCRYVSQYCAHLCRHEDYSTSQELLNQAITEPVVPQGAQLHKCSKCRFATNVVSALSRHMRFHRSGDLQEQLDEVEQKSGGHHTDNENKSERDGESRCGNKEPLSYESEEINAEDRHMPIGHPNRDQLSIHNNSEEGKGGMEPQVGENDKIIFESLSLAKTSIPDRSHSTDGGKQYSSDITKGQQNLTSSMEVYGTDKNQEISSQLISASEIITEDNNASSSVLTEEDVDHDSEVNSGSSVAYNVCGSNLAVGSLVPAECSIPLEYSSMTDKSLVPVQQQEVGSAVSGTEIEGETTSSSPRGMLRAEDTRCQALHSSSRSPDQAFKSTSDNLLSQATCKWNDENGDASLRTSADVADPMSSVHLHRKNRKVKATLRRRKKSRPSTSVCRKLRSSSRSGRNKRIAETVERVLRRVMNEPPTKRSNAGSRNTALHRTKQDCDPGIQSSTQSCGDDAAENSRGVDSESFKQSNNVESPVEKQSFNCEHCHFETDSHVVFSYHMRKHAPKNGVVTRREYPCPHCSFKSANKNYMKRHIRLHTGDNLYQCPHCPYKTALSKSYREHVDNHGGKRFSCSKCTYSSAYETCYKRHLLTHDSTNLLHCGCYGCKFSTFRADVLRMHRATHVSDKKFKCSLCLYQTAASYMLKLHMKRHTGEGLLQCPYCSFVTAKRINLDDHVRFHTGEGRLDCQVAGCEYFCFRGLYYRKHLLKHHGIKGPKSARAKDL